MKEYRDDVRRRAAKFGRNPDDIKVLWLFSPVMGETEAEAWMINERGMSQDRFAERRLSLISGITDIDFSKFPSGRAVAAGSHDQRRVDFTQEIRATRQRQDPCGSSSRRPANPAALMPSAHPIRSRYIMGEIMAEVGGDGFLIRNPFHHMTRRYIARSPTDSSRHCSGAASSAPSTPSRRFAKHLLEF